MLFEEISKRLIHKLTTVVRMKNLNVGMKPCDKHFVTRLLTVITYALLCMFLNVYTKRRKGMQAEEGAVWVETVAKGMVR